MALSLPVMLQLFLVDVESQMKTSLLSYCSYVQVGGDSVGTD